MADPNQSQTPTQQEYDRDQAGATPPTPAPDDSLEGWTPVEGTQKAAASPTPAEDKSLEGWTPVEGTAKSIEQPSSQADPYGGAGYAKIYSSLKDFAAARNVTMTGSENLQELYNKIKDVGTGPVPPGFEAIGPEIRQIELAAGLAKGAWEAQKHETQTGLEQMDKPGLLNKAGGAIRYIQGGIPLLGPLLGAIEDHISNGEYTKAAGVASTLASPELIEKTGTKIVDTFKNAVNNNSTADAIYKTRVQDVKVATEQAADARRRAEQAAQDEATGKGTKAQTDAANSLASEMAANAAKAQEGLKTAEENKAKAAVAVTQAGRNISKAAKPKVKPKEEVKIGTPEDATAAKNDFQKSIPQSKAAPYSDEDYEIGRGYLERHHTDVENVGDVEGTRDAFEYERQGIENKVRGAVTKYAKEPILTNVKSDVMSALAETDKVKAGFLDDGMKALEDYNLTDPTMEEADAIRAQLNSENRATLKKNSWDVSTALDTDPAFAARYHAAESLRNGIYDQLENKGVKGAREMRQDESALIRLRNAADRQVFNNAKGVRGTGEAGPVRKIGATVAKAGATAVGTGVGAAVAGVPGAIVGGAVGAAGGEALGRMISTPDLTHDQLIERSMGKKVATVQPAELSGEGRPSAPPVEPLPPPAEPPVNPRENTELHAALATHYDEQIGDTPYAELEERFLSDIAVKKKYNVPLDPQERKINLEINKSKVEEIQRARGIAEEQKKAAEKAAVDAEKEKKEKEAQGLKTNLASPFETEPHLSPEDERALHHELGHHFQIAKAGHPTQDIIGRQHPEIDAGAQAEARWDPSAFFDENGKLDLGKVRDNIESILDIFHGGAVADEVMNDIPVHKNSGAKTDLRRARTKLIEAGFSPSEAGQLMAASEGRVRKDFTAPGVRDIFQRYSQAREAGLDDGLLMSEETSGRAVQEFKDALEGGKEVGNETNNKQKAVGKNGGSNREGKPGGAGRVPPKRPGEDGITAPPREGSGAGEELRANLKDKEAPPITEIIPELKGHPELEKKIKDLGFESALQKEWMRQQGQKKAPVEYRPSEKAETMSARRTSDLGPEFLQAEHAHEANRLKQIVEDPNASEEEKTIAVQRLKEGTELPAKVLPPERTTGVAEHDAAIKAGGGTPGGVTDLGEFGKIYNFHDPLTGSTLGFKEGKEITPETVKEQIKKSREAFGIKEEPVKEDHDKHARNHEGEQ